MPRTPLLRSLEKLAPLVTGSRQTGIPVGAAALAVPRRVMAATQPKVVIVGGGIAGLTCALKLRDKGFALTVYEASGRLGGRMFSNTSYWNAGQVSEWCGELIDTSHKTIQNLAARYSLPLDALHAAEPTGSNDTYFVGGHYYVYIQAVAVFIVIADILHAYVVGSVYSSLFNSSTSYGA